MTDFTEIRFDSPQVEAGGMVHGCLFFLDESSSLDKCKQLVVRCRARVHGSGDSELIEVDPPLARDGAIAVPLKVPFEFEIPDDGPVSYDGRYVKVTWEIEVRLDVPWALDPKQVAVFRVVPRGPAHLPG